MIKKLYIFAYFTLLFAILFFLLCRLLESIEQKRVNINELNQLSEEKSKESNVKESEMIDLERELVQILIEQQKSVMMLVDNRGSIDGKCREVIGSSNIPWPPPDNPSSRDVDVLFTKGFPLYIEM